MTFMLIPIRLVAFVLVIHSAAGSSVSEPAAQSVSARKDPSTLANLSESFQHLAERVGPAVVQIQCTGFAATQGGDTSPGVIASQRSSGSGVILDPEGYILTNAHVVRGAQRVEVLLPRPPDSKAQWRSILKPSGKLVPAQTAGIDPETDLAVLKIDAQGLPALALGDSETLRQGQVVLAFGSPLGLENSVSMGVVSSVARQLRPEASVIYIQTAPAINPGNSGGPLVDAEGRVVGINTFILSQSGGNEGLGFALPSNIARNVYTQIRKLGRVRRGQIGIRAQTITPTLAAGLKLSRDWGALLEDILPNGPAEEAGLKVGDIVLSLNGKTMENARQFEVNLYQQPIGEYASVEILRGADRLTKRVRVADRMDDPARFMGMVSREKNLVARLGILALDIDEKIAELLPPLRKPAGVVVAGRVAFAPYIEENLLPGDLVVSLNGEAVQDVAALRAMLKKLSSGSPVVLQVQRFGQLRFLAFELD